VWILYDSASEKMTLGAYGDNFEGRVLKLVGISAGLSEVVLYSFVDRRDVT